MLELDAHKLVASLKSGTCPACGRKKKPEMTFCARDYYALPFGEQRALYVFGDLDKYGAAVTMAMTTLGRTEFKMPAKWIPLAPPEKWGARAVDGA